MKLPQVTRITVANCDEAGAAVAVIFISWKSPAPLGAPDDTRLYRSVRGSMRPHPYLSLDGQRAVDIQAAHAVAHRRQRVRLHAERLEAEVGVFDIARQPDGDGFAAVRHLHRAQADRKHVDRAAHIFQHDVAALAVAVEADGQPAVRHRADQGRIVEHDMGREVQAVAADHARQFAIVERPQGRRGAGRGAEYRGEQESESRCAHQLWNLMSRYWIWIEPMREAPRSTVGWLGALNEILPMAMRAARPKARPSFCCGVENCRPPPDSTRSVMATLPLALLMPFASMPQS